MTYFEHRTANVQHRTPKKEQIKHILKNGYLGEMPTTMSSFIAYQHTILIAFYHFNGLEVRGFELGAYSGDPLAT